MLEELAKEDLQVLALAYTYAKNLHMFGEDVTKEWATAIQNVSALQKAYTQGYYEALKKQTESEDNDIKTTLNEINDIHERIRQCNERYEKRMAELERPVEFYDINGPLKITREEDNNG